VIKSLAPIKDNTETFFSNSQRIKASETFPALGPENPAPIKNNTEDEDD
jgi:hypothetical protein